ncbi:MAG TPA: tetratricopeptide repeat protein, partial [Candidatus Deferrimicrobiaceae bacterium]|nr:tetratricopeptide repeat protein [Candidatus Deferrimicrobiaceae bacterium]
MRRRRLYAALAMGALLLGCGAPSQERKKEASARMGMGMTYLEQRNLPSAMRELTKASELDPENAEIDVALGLAYQARGDVGKAAECFRNAIRKKPDYAEAHNDLGIALSQLGRGDEAIREFEAAAANVLYVTPEIAYYNLGEEYRRRKDFKKAGDMYRRSISMNDRYADAYLRLAFLDADQGRWAEAARTLEACVAVAPAYAPAWLDLGRAYRALGRSGDARGAFLNAMSNTADPVLR